MKVKEVMTAKALRSCSPESKLQEAAKSMKAGNCGVLPVTDNNKKVVGIITDRDICLSLSQENTKTHADIHVSEVMGKNVHTVKENDDVTVALKQMRTNHVGRLPVVDESGKLKGILSLHNLMSQSFDVQASKAEDISGQYETVLKTLKALSGRYSKSESNKTENLLSHVL